MARIKYYDEATGTWKYADEAVHISPVQSVNGKTGAVVLTPEDIGADGSGAVVVHNANEEAHPYILGLLSSLENKAMLKSDISIKKAKLTLEDGTQILIDVVVASDGTTIIAYTNQIPLSINADGTIYNGTGYKEGYRLSSSGAEKAITATNSIISGFIPVKQGDVVRLKGCSWIRNNPSNASDGAGNYLCGYDSSFTFIGGVLGNGYTTNTSVGGYGTWISGAEVRPTISFNIPEGSITTHYIEVTVNDPNVAYIRFNCFTASENTVTEDDFDPAGVILTVNEEIPE